MGDPQRKVERIAIADGPATATCVRCEWTRSGGTRAWVQRHARRHARECGGPVAYSSGEAVYFRVAS